MATHLPFTVYGTMTTTPFPGNPTPVFILNHLNAWLSERSMQLVAGVPTPFYFIKSINIIRELNHSETVFLRNRPNSPPKSFEIRWFTPTAEEPFCGHGIVGAAHALHASGLGNTFEFITYTGIKAQASIVTTSTARTISKDQVTISSSLPESPVFSYLAITEDVKNSFATAMGIDTAKVIAIGQNELIDIIIELDPKLAFSASNLSIDPVALLNASPAGIRSQVVTSSWSFVPGVDFAKRVFAYGSEDQATGSTYCALAQYCGERLGKRSLRCSQVSGRGGGADLRSEVGGGGGTGFGGECEGF